MKVYEIPTLPPYLVVFGQDAAGNWHMLDTRRKPSTPEMTEFLENLVRHGAVALRR